MKPKASFPHYVTMIALTDSKKMSNHYNESCFVSQKLRLFSKTIWESAYEAFDYQSFLIIIGKLSLIVNSL